MLTLPGPGFSINNVFSSSLRFFAIKKKQKDS